MLSFVQHHSRHSEQHRTRPHPRNDRIMLSACFFRPFRSGRALRMLRRPLRISRCRTTVHQEQNWIDRLRL